MNHQSKSYIPVVIAFILGLGIPKTFTLLYIILLIGYYGHLKNGSWKFSLALSISALSLLLFGISYSVVQIWHSIWTPWYSYMPEIMAVSVLPASCLVAGWLFGTQPTTKSTQYLTSYSVGCLVYALLCIMRSHQPWWNLTQTMHHVMLVPWGDPQWLSIRAIEQRGFLAFAFFASVVPLSKSFRANKVSVVLYSILGVMGLYVTYTTQSRIGIFTLYLALIPTISFLASRFYRLIILTVAAVPLIIGILSRHICDERISLLMNFIREMPNGLMGGRVITFAYQSCSNDEILTFGSSVNTDAFTPHNVILDVYNDAGVVPFLFLLAAITTLGVWWLKNFHKSIKGKGLTLGLAVRWAIFCVLSVQWFAQPFMYTDQLMFSLGFLFLGITLREFNSSDKLILEHTKLKS